MYLSVKMLDGFELSAAGLNKASECKAQFWHRYVGKTPQLAPGRKYKMKSGTRVHAIEKAFWDFVRGGNYNPSALRDAILERPPRPPRYLELFPPHLMKDIDAENLAKRMTQIKIRMLYSVETAEYTPYLYNLSMIDAVRWIQLRQHFNGDVMKCYKYWIPIACEFAQFIIRLRTLVIIDRINIIPSGFLGMSQESLLIGDYKPGKFDEEGNPKLPDDIRNYDYGRFKRQLVFYGYSLKFPGKHREPISPAEWWKIFTEARILDENGLCEIDVLGDKKGHGQNPGGWCDYDKSLYGKLPDVIPVGYIGGFMYKTGQCIIEPLAKRSLTDLQKAVQSLWDMSYFPRNIDHREQGRCNYCDYKPSCLDNLELLTMWGQTDGFIISEVSDKDEQEPDVEE